MVEKTDQLEVGLLFNKVKEIHNSSNKVNMEEVLDLKRNNTISNKTRI
jgi:hypothetical protein